MRLVNGLCIKFTVEQIVSPSKVLMSGKICAAPIAALATNTLSRSKTQPFHTKKPCVPFFLSLLAPVSLLPLMGLWLQSMGKV